jgi:hypothetical protein
VTNEPIYSIQRMAAEAAYAQEIKNIIRRFLGLSVTKTAKMAELEVLSKYGVNSSYATWQLSTKINGT